MKGPLPAAEQQAAYYYLLGVTNVADDPRDPPDGELQDQLLAIGRRMFAPMLSGRRSRS